MTSRPLSPGTGDTRPRQMLRGQAEPSPGSGDTPPTSRGGLSSSQEISGEQRQCSHPTSICYLLRFFSEIIDGIDETRRSESAYFNRRSPTSTCLTREETLRSSKSSLEVRESPLPNLEIEDSDSVNNEDSGFTSIKVMNEMN